MNVDYGPALQTIDVGIPPADLGVTTQPTTPSYPSGITPTDSIIPVADLGGNDSIDVQTQVDTFSNMPSWDTSSVSAVTPFTGTDSVFTGDEIDVAWAGLHPSFDYSAHGSAGSGISPLPAWTGLVTKALPAVAASTAVVDVLANERDRQIAADIERTTQVDTFASGGQVQPLPEFVQDIVSKNTQKDKDKQAAIAAAAASARASKRAIAKANAAANREKKAAARRAAAAQRALDSARAAAARAVAASAAQAKTAQANARAVLAAAAGRDRGGPSAREIAAAIEVMSQVDSFGSGGQRGFMGAEIGIEDGGGYTGGDFSSGAGWE